MRKKKEFKPFDFVMEHGKIQIGTLGVTGLAGRMPSSLQSGQIQSSMGTMTMIPRIHAIGGAFGSIRQLERSIKKKKK